MMSFKVATILTLAAVLASPVLADEEKPAEQPAEAVQENPELEGEIAYVEKLVDNGYPDIAAPVIEATKKKWPESEVRFFAIEIRGLLALGKFDEAEKKIAALPDRKSSKYWAARLEVANNYFARSQKEECMKIYGEFFDVFKKPPKEIRQFYLNACYAYGQLLIGDSQYRKASERYADLLTQLREGDDDWCNLACETAEIYLRLANDAKDPKQAGQRKADLAAAGKLADKLLWQIEKPVFFGRAVSMKAHVEQMKGDIVKATAIIDEYKPQLIEIHDQIVQYDSDGKLGLLKQSPLPECLYLQAKMLWDAAQEEFKAAKRDDEKVKTYLFGPKPKGDGKRAFAKGCFAMSQTVFLNYETSVWAPAAGDLAEAIKKFTKEKYGKDVNTRVTAEQKAKVRAAQFKEANEKFVQQQYLEAIKAYYAVLARFPEYPESVMAVENIASCYLDLILETQDEAKKEEYRLDADAVEGYLAERFAGAKDKAMMIAAGDATLRIAHKEKEYKNLDRVERLYREFVVNYRLHPQAALVAVSRANELKQDEDFAGAIEYYGLVAAYYTNTTHYATALAQLSWCNGKLGNKQEEIDYITRYLDVETVKIRRLQAQFQLAQMYQKDGLAILNSAETNATPEAVEQDEKHGTAQIIRAIKQFVGFQKQADGALKDPATPQADVAKYRQLHEAAMFMTGECWSRMNRPEKNLPTYRERAAQSYESYVTAYPKGQWAEAGYLKLGTIYTLLKDMAKSKDALERLSREYPDSDSAKNAKPRLAKNLIEMGLRREGTEIYAEMLRTDGAYTAVQFLNAGDALIDAKSWDLANQAFEKAIRLAGTNQVTVVAKSRLGQARSAWKQGSLMEAREALDLFLADPKMSRMAIAADANFMLVEVASDQGRTEKDATMRGKYFGAAIGALKKVRQYWKSKPQWEQDQLDLLSGDVLVDRMKAEEAMDLKEDAMDTCGLAAGKFQTFIQSHGVTESHPLDKMDPGEKANLERAYATMLPLFIKQGAKQADLVVRYGKEYLALFPHGKARTDVENCINQAKADLPAGGAAEAPKPAAETPAAEGESES